MSEFKVTVEYCWSEGKGLQDLRQTANKAPRGTRRERKGQGTVTRRSARVKRKQDSDEAAQQIEHQDEEPAMELN